ncbi:IclR family transcriptional regulator [Oligella urethralis]|uniref:IclR family transcriptional regulator n=1 Tax=Oligella urethralis TaxID=90245 RepID=UPI000477E3C2|nr:IclR family transcriptional regulator [Oligella urethralis]
MKDINVVTTNSAATRALMIVEVLANSEEPLSLNALCAKIAIPRSTLMRNLNSLCEAGFVVRLPEQLGYTVGARSVSFCVNALRTTRFSVAARSILRRTVSKINETCNLTVLDEDSVRYLVRVENTAPWSLQLNVKPNTSVPLHCTASGKLFLSNLSHFEQSTFLKNIELTAFTDNTITDLEEFKKELAKTKRQGFGLDKEEFVTGMVALAVPVYDPYHKSRIIATVACHAVTARTCLSRLLSCRVVMEEAAEEVRELLGFNT